MYPFVSAAGMALIFGADFYASEESIGIIRQLSGMSGPKPFECVGATDEMIAALWMSIEKCQPGDGPLPVALQYARENILPLHADAKSLASGLLASYGPHRLPPQFEAILKSYDLR